MQKLAENHAWLRLSRCNLQLPCDVCKFDMYVGIGSAPNTEWCLARFSGISLSHYERSGLPKFNSLPFHLPLHAGTDPLCCSDADSVEL